MYRRSICGFFLALILVSVPCRAHSAGRDTLIFQREFGYKFVSNYVGIPLLANVYRYLVKAGDSRPQQYSGFPVSDGYYDNYTYSDRPDWASRFVQYDDAAFSAALYSSREEYSAYDLSSLSISQLATAAKAYRASYADKGAEKRRLVQALTAFDTAAVNKPVFFSEIYGKFKGNIGKYVDHLYKHSILCSKSRMDKFVRYPKAEELQKDPGVQFVIGMALYELWIKDVREGRVAEVR